MTTRGRHDGLVNAVGSTRSSRSGGALRAVFAVPEFRRLWAARTVLQWGDVAAAVALGLLVLELTGSGLGAAGVVAAEIVPVLLLAPIAGVVIDGCRGER